MSVEMQFCPRCASELTDKVEEGRTRRACLKEGCGFIHYGNPLPVVAAIVEHEGAVVLVRSHGWPEKLFGLVTGFLEAGESPEEGVLREVKEELDLDGEVVGLIGAYSFQMRNELIVAFHVRATGVLKLGAELAGFKKIAPEKLRPWDFGTGLAVRDWLAKRPSGS
jgi:NAD+ diphosphatase